MIFRRCLTKADTLHAYFYGFREDRLRLSGCRPVDEHADRQEEENPGYRARSFFLFHINALSCAESLS